MNQKPDLDCQISDQHVYKFTYLVEDTMRIRVDHGRASEEGLSAMQVILAAFASAFSATTGVHPDVVTTLAGLSAFTVDIAGIINAGDKAKACSQSQELIEQGYAMAEPSPSLLQVELTVQKDRIINLEAGGRAAISHWLEVEVAD